ncbi:g3376 [Coccomyxa elongata]
MKAAVCQRWAEEDKFVAYFKKEWGQKLGMIMQVYRDLAKCAINCTSHVEGWHMTLKFRFLSGRRRLTNRQIDWLLWILHTRVAEYYHSRMQEQDLGAPQQQG